MGLSENLSRGRFAVLGRVGMDLYADPPMTPIEEAETFVTSLGGSSGNIAVGLSRLGLQVCMVSVVSDDAVGRYTRNQLAKAGVDTSHVRTESGEARTTLAVVDTCRERTQAVIYRNGPADFALCREDIERIDIAALGGLIFTGTALAREPSRTAVFYAQERARAQGVPTICDLDFRSYSWASRREAAEVCARAARGCQVVVGNDDEFGLLAGSREGGLDFARGLLSAGPTWVVYKMGRRGAITLTAQGEHYARAFSVDALKPTGAGDSFLSGLLAALAAGKALKEAVAFGSAAAALVVGRVGCASAMPTLAEVEGFLQQRALAAVTDGPQEMGLVEV